LLLLLLPLLRRLTPEVSSSRKLKRRATSLSSFKRRSPHFLSFLDSGRYDDLSYSLVLPFWDRPSKLDGSHAGDFGFDPLGFTENNDLYYLQECELRHARLAMLAVAGWPLSELLAPSFMLQDGRAPSVLNGVNPASGLFILGAFAAFGYFETVTALRKTDNTLIGKKHANDMALIWKWGVAGDYNWDPANLYNSLGDDAAGRKGLREVEVMQGRYAMVAITYFAVWEALTRSPIVENNMFFHPNTLLPLIGVAHGIWSQFYQVSDLRKYPIQIEYTKDGEEMLRGAGRSTEGIAGSLASVVSAAGVITSKFGDLTNMVLEKVQTNSEEK
jgi:Chlorophyll A-B binding protein